MKGIGKAFARAPHMLKGTIGQSTKSQDAETNELVRKFSGLEEYTAKLVKDTSSFREATSAMLTAQAGFATTFTTLFTPLGDEHSLTSRHPGAEHTLRNIDQYQDLMAELRDAVQPELELIDSRITAPLKEYQELLKKIRKTITKREHKLVDFDRHNNSYSKLKEKKEKSLSDEKNLFKYEQDLEVATQEYEHYNSMLQSEIPHFLALSTTFITPLFQSYYFIQIGILYTLLEKMQSFSTNTYGADAGDVSGLESFHFEKMGDTQEKIEALTITKRITSTARLVSQKRADSGSSLGRASSNASSFSARPSAVASSSYGASEAAPPPAYAAGGAAAPLSGKRAPPPPPGRPGAAKKVETVTAIYDYAATSETDLSFTAGDTIEIVKRTESENDWWTGRDSQGREGTFPANYVSQT